MGRGRFNIHGAMNAETFETTAVTSESNINQDSTIDLFKSLEAVYPLAETLYVILDNARYHYSAQVLDYVKTSRIKLVFLPSYSPQLNLIERLWRVFNKKVLYNKFYKSFKNFKAACIGFFQNQGEHYQDIVSIMGEGLTGVSL